MANTCSPSHDQLHLTGTPVQNLANIEAIYDLIFPWTLCPPALFFSLIRINQLRARVSASLFSREIDPRHSLEAHSLLTTIEDFIPIDWAQPGLHYDEWLLIGNTYQSSIALYCILGFQSLAIIPSTPSINSRRTAHANTLLCTLREALTMPRLVNFMMWPLTVLGVEAGYRDAGTRYWIGKRFEELARVLGTSGPLKSLAVLRTYWQKRKPGWEECFDKAYVFIM
jgi:hypothetical protein